jgi:hypothetical protein
MNEISSVTSKEENVWEEDAKENVWTEEGWISSRLEKII